jgi:hypothetical protein
MRSTPRSTRPTSVRFTDALRDLSEATQCIVITHNRGTIEVADALYGVTVGDDSVSRVISLGSTRQPRLRSEARRIEPDSHPSSSASRSSDGARGAPSELEDGLRRSRGGFMSRLRGLLGAIRSRPRTGPRSRRA